MTIILDTVFVDSFQKLFPRAYQLYSNKFQKVEFNDGEVLTEYFVVDQDNTFNFPQFFLEHKIGIGKKYSYYNSGTEFGLNITAEFLASHLDQDIEALQLHKAYFLQLDVQESRQKAYSETLPVQEANTVTAGN